MNNELILSTDINVITAEINSYKQIAGQSIFEIGKRLKHVKENPQCCNLNQYGEFGQWANDEFGFTSSMTSNYISAFEQFAELPMSAILSTSKILEIIALPRSTDRQEFIEQPHTIPSTGETKTVDEMTVRELREVKAELKKKDEDLKREQTAKAALIKTLEGIQNQKPKVIEVVKEIVPVHMKAEINDLRNKLSSEKQNNEKSRNRLVVLEQEVAKSQLEKQKIEEYLHSEDREIDKLKKEKEKLELQAHISISELQIGIQKCVETFAPSVFLQGAVASSTIIMRDDLLDSIVALEEFVGTLRNLLNAKITKNIIDVEY